MSDAVPDIIRPASSQARGPMKVDDQHGTTSADVPIPLTVITKVDSKPSHGEVPGTEAYDMRKGDAKPDIVRKTGDVHSE